jgi:hypothetical protein
MKTTNVSLEIEGVKFNKEIFVNSGVFVIKNFIPQDKIKFLQITWIIAFQMKAKEWYYKNFLVMSSHLMKF